MKRRIAEKIVFDRILPSIAPFVARGEGVCYTDRERQAARVFIRTRRRPRIATHRIKALSIGVDMGDSFESISSVILHMIAASFQIPPIVMVHHVDRMPVSGLLTWQKPSEFEKETVTLLVHKYHYYIEDAPIVTDAEYDAMERKWKERGILIGVNMDAYPNWIGFDEKHPLAAKAVEEIKKQRSES